MRINAIFAAAILALGSAAASAATTAWGEHNNPFEFGGGFASGAGALISDTFTFTLSSAAGVLGVGVSNDGGILNLTDGVVSLFMVGNATPIGSFSFDSTAVTHNFGTLASGSYFYTVTATVASDAMAGTYQLNSQLVAAPVPEPESYALMLAGLGAVGYLARRRKPAA